MIDALHETPLRRIEENTAKQARYQEEMNNTLKGILNMLQALYQNQLRENPKLLQEGSIY